MSAFVCSLQRIDPQNGPSDLALFNAFFFGGAYYLTQFIGAKFMDDGKPELAFGVWGFVNATFIICALFLTKDIEANFEISEDN